MRIKVNSEWHDGKDEFIMVELSKYDRKNIENMPKSNKKYAQFPDGTPIDEEMADFMEAPLRILQVKKEK